MTDKTSKEMSRDQYSQVGDAYVRSQTHAKGVDLDYLLDMVQPQKDWQVLDVATGGGHTALTLAPYVQQVIAVDLTPNMVETAKKFVCDEKGQTNVTFQLADAENLPFENGSFDLVTCRIAAHHFPDCQKFIAQSVRVLKQGGLLAVQDHVLPTEENHALYVDQFERRRDPSHFRAYSEQQWRRMFENGGLQVEQTRQLTKRHNFTDWAKRMNCTEETLEELVAMIKNAPDTVIAWLEPLPDADHFGEKETSFVNHHIIVVGRKG
ncbi:class I SAM-dependent methyltransferase [uncultured Desulfuromonas sp.]|uniref:class I SAM-dependent methyltransferase n=1 Tax=uncultured Desulfuromonas sp. TaxID=181013 RepID=UPI002AAC0DAD|nr:class I SAM-dependent methyltransferase [uncultured Desulfuromonas sp.]